MWYDGIIKSRLNQERNKANAEIIGLLCKFLQKHPGIRFCQALQILGINATDKNYPRTLEDRFHRESSKTLEDVLQSINKLNNEKSMDKSED